MRVETVNGPSQVHQIDAARVIVYGPLGTPIMVAVEWAPGLCYISKAGDDDFFSVLEMAGLDQIQLQKLRPRSLAEMRGSAF